MGEEVNVETQPIENYQQAVDLFMGWQEEQDASRRESLEKAFDKLGVDLTQGIGEAFEQALLKFDLVGPPPDSAADPDSDGKSFGDFLFSVKEARSGGANAHKRLTDVYKTALAEGSGVTGGYIVPNEWSAQMLETSWEQSIVADAGAVRIPMSRRILEMPVLDVTTAPSAGQTAQFGGMVMAWKGEAAALGETEPQFRDLKLEAHKLCGYALASNELLADSAIGIEMLLRRLGAGAIAWHKDYAFLRGTGAASPLGILTWITSVGVSSVGATKTTASRFKIPDAANMIKLLMPGSYGRAVWIAHQSFIPELIRLSTVSEVTTSGGAVLTWEPDSKNGSIFPLTLYGRPVYITEKLPAINTDGSIILADMQYYYIGDRQDLAIDYSEHYKFVNDQAAFRFITRCDGQPALNSYVTLADASTKVSPFVTVNY